MLALALLTGDPNSSPANLDRLCEAFPALRQPLTKLALDQQILDTRETRFVLERARDLEEDLRMLRRRNRELGAAPRLAEADRFPPRTQANELLVKNRERRQALADRKPGNATEALTTAKEMTELDRLYRIWDAVRDAQCEYFYVTVRRQALARLKELIGEADFRAAKLPPAVP